MTLSEPTADEKGASGGQSPPETMTTPIYKGAPLDSERGPGLGCFWFQVVLLVVLLVATPLSVWLAFEPWVSAAMLILTLVLLFFVGQTMIFLLRLVAADRRAQRRPLREGARKTVGQLEREVDLGEDTSDSDEDDAGPGQR